MPIPELDNRLILNCLEANARGDATIYSILHQGKVACNKDSGEPLIYNGNHWKIDTFDYSKERVEQVALTYLQTSLQFEQQAAEAEQAGKTEEAKSLQGLVKKLKKRADRLRSPAGANACLDFAFALQGELSLGVSGDMLDQNPWVLACKNGVLELDTGELRTGRPRDYLLRAAAVDMPDLEEPCPTWERFLWECLEDQEIINFLQRYFGYCLTGFTDEQRFLILSGVGRNGKGVFLETILRIFGDLGKPVQAEMLLDQGRKTASGPSPDVMDLLGLRLAVASESDEARRFSPSRIKWFTGSDTLAGRNPHDRRMTRFRPTHKLVLQTNSDPHAPADDFAFWSRLLKVDWPFQFVKNPRRSTEKLRDDHLMSKLEKELPGILAWLARGCIYWQREGLAVPQQVTSAVQAYQRAEDLVQDWVDERCLTDDAGKLEVTAQDAYLDFCAWFEKYHSKKAPSMSWFGRRMSRKFPREKKGVYRYLGVGLMSD